MEGKRTDFCPECRKNTEYIVKKVRFPKKIEGTPYVFNVSAAFCTECGGEVSPPGSIDQMIQDIQEQYLRRKKL